MKWGAGGEDVWCRAVAFWKCEQGQDMVEYALLLAFICLVGVAAFLGMTGPTSSMWSTVNSRLAAPNQAS
jgi:Flp pilus assembly pilin Flp